MRQFSCCVLALSVIAFSATGCGESLKLLPAGGTVTYQGKPVEGALVTFLNQENVLGSGTTDAAGKYTISTLGKAGATMGKHQVAITKTSGGSTATSGSGARSGPPSPEEIKKLQDDMKSGMAGSKTTELLPAKYANPAQSGFTVDVKAGNATFDFTLTD